MGSIKPGSKDPDMDERGMLYPTRVAPHEGTFETDATQARTNGHLCRPGFFEPTGEVSWIMDEARAKELYGFLPPTASFEVTDTELNVYLPNVEPAKRYRG